MIDSEFLENYGLYSKFKTECPIYLDDVEAPTINMYCKNCNREQTYHNYTEPRYGSRATILYYILKDKGLNPKRKIGVKPPTTHHVVESGGKIYDANIEPSQNPINIKEYEKKMDSFEWKYWEDKEKDNNPIDYAWNYSERFDGKFKEYVRNLMRKDYEAYKEEYLIEENTFEYPSE